MVRKLAVVLVLAVAWLPLVVNPLGVGDIEVHSSLNQPLNAEITLHSLRRGDAERLQVSLASRDAFQRAGLDRPALLDTLQFSVERGDDGGGVIRVQTDDPVREPFLSFIVELNWPQGRLMREYTLLLDPQDADRPRREAAPPRRPGVAEAPPRPEERERGVERERRSPAEDTTPRRQDTQRPRAERQEYGPTGEADTLWSIAQQMRPDTRVSMEQMMLGLLEANPDAFEDGNINRLQTGHILRMPERRQLTALDRREASREVERQMQAWREQRQRMAEAEAPAVPAEQAPELDGAPDADARLRLMAPEDEADAEPSSDRDTPAAAPGTDPDVAEELRALRQELALVLEAAESQRQENRELRARLSELEEQMAGMRRLLTLRSEELATLQHELGRDDEVPDVAAVQLDDQRETEPEPEAEAEAEADDEAPAVAAGPAEPAPADTAPSEPTEPGLVDRTIQTVTSSVTQFVQGPPYNLALVGGAFLILLTLVYVRRRRQAMAEALDDMEASASHDTSVTSVEAQGDARAQAAGVAVTTAGATGAAGDTTGPEALGDPQASAGGDDLMVDHLDTAEFGGAGEADVLTEADVYMAYGRYRQAEELLRDAMAREGDRPEWAAKLFEVLHRAGKGEAFQAEAERWHTTHGSDTIVWPQVLVWGRELVPDHPLFQQADAKTDAGHSTAAVTAGHAAGSSTGDAMAADTSESADLDAATATTESKTVGGDVAATDAGDNSIDFDLDLSALRQELASSKPPQGESAADDAADDVPGLDFEPGLHSRDTEAHTPNDPAGDDDEEVIAGGLELHLDDLTGETAHSGDTELPGDADGGVREHSLDLESGLDDGDGELDWEQFKVDASPSPSSGTSTGDAAGGTDAMELDWTGLSLDGDSEVADAGPGVDKHDTAGDGLAPEPDLMGAGGSIDDSGQSGAADDVYSDDAVELEFDEVGTKLDLARAYIDMGDADGARSILQEVLAEGTGAQRQDAQQLMERLT